MAQVPSHRLALANAAVHCEGPYGPGPDRADAFNFRTGFQIVFGITLPAAYVLQGALSAGLVRGFSRVMLVLPQTKMTTVAALGLRQNAFRIGVAVCAFRAVSSVTSGFHEAVMSIPDALIMSTPSDAGARMRSAYERVFPASPLLEASNACAAAQSATLPGAGSSAYTAKVVDLLRCVVLTHLELSAIEMRCRQQ